MNLSKINKFNMEGWIVLQEKNETIYMKMESDV